MSTSLLLEAPSPVNLVQWQPAPPLCAGPEMAALTPFHSNCAWQGMVAANGTGPGSPEMTAVGMFGVGALWLVPLTSATVTVAVGSIVKRPVFIEGDLMEREYLCLTLSFNHDIVDGAPAARFTHRFAELLASGDEISELLNLDLCISREKTC
ncbi:MAG: 2-oxo acid dehydrogenase subunit E2 [Caldilineaceae bacterium]